MRSSIECKLALNLRAAPLRMLVDVLGELAPAARLSAHTRSAHAGGPMTEFATNVLYYGDNLVGYPR